MSRVPPRRAPGSAPRPPGRGLDGGRRPSPRTADGPGGASPGPRPFLVAVVDSGINPSHRQVGPVAGGTAIEVRGTRVGIRADWSDRLGHGTAVAAAISEGLPVSGWALLSVRVFTRRLTAKPAGLAAGIRWAVRQGARVVNLSAGVPAGSDPEGEKLLRSAAMEAGAAGVVLIAPRWSQGELLVPGALPRVPGLISVEADDRLERGQLRRRGPDRLASPWARPLPPLPRRRNFRGVSFAVAAVTNHFLRGILSERASPRSRARNRFRRRTGRDGAVPVRPGRGPT